MSKTSSPTQDRNTGAIGSPKCLSHSSVPKTSQVEIFLLSSVLSLWSPWKQVDLEHGKKIITSANTAGTWETWPHLLICMTQSVNKTLERKVTSPPSPGFLSKSLLTGLAFLMQLSLVLPLSMFSCSL